jgi:DNA-binding transcriptional regulator GbsR (MarR family)
MNFKYNPGFSSDEDLIDAFVVRQVELQQILQTIQENTGRTYQHLLLVGARGTGKTMLVRRVAAEIRRSESFNQHWYPLVFGEESYRILSAGEFWLEALYHLAAQNPGAQWQGVYEELRGEKDEKRLQQRSIAKLMDFADEQDKQILLIVENLNMLFDEQMSDGDDWDLRHTLQNEPRLMLLGTATQRFDEIDNVNKAWFDFFSLHVIEPLKLAECSQFWKSVTDESLSDQQIRPMQILTGGNVRLLQVLAGFARGTSFRDLMANLTQLIDSHTDYFKNLLEALPATERKVFVEVLELWKPTNTSSIASAARMETSKASAILNRLQHRGAIELVKQSGKKKYFQASERLFNIYYLMRKRGAVDSRVKVAIKFMSMFYPDCHEQIKIVAKEACSLPNDLRIDHLWALSFILKGISNSNSRNKVLKLIPKDIQDSIEMLLSIKKMRKPYFDETDLAAEELFLEGELVKEKIKYWKERNESNKNSHQSTGEWVGVDLVETINHFAIKSNVFMLQSQIASYCDSQYLINYSNSINKNARTDLTQEFERTMGILIGFSASGYADKVLEIIESTEANKPEPLIVGLRIFLGVECPLVAKEIFEMGKDIADRIRTKQAELAKSQSENQP